MKKSGKIKNTTPTVFGDVNYRSKLEAYMAMLLTNNNIEFSYESKIFEILPPFDFHGEKVRPITYKPDFIVDNHVIEIKGFPNDAWPLREKMFKYSIKDLDIHYHIARNQKECQAVISKILHVQRTREHIK